MSKGRADDHPGSIHPPPPRRKIPSPRIITACVREILVLAYAKTEQEQDTILFPPSESNPFILHLSFSLYLSFSLLYTLVYRLRFYFFIAQEEDKMEEDWRRSGGGLEEDGGGWRRMEENFSRGRGMKEDRGRLEEDGEEWRRIGRGWRRDGGGWRRMKKDF